MSTTPIYQVDTFTKESFSGNYAAVCLLAPEQAVPDAIKQKIAAEMNLPETAFVQPLPGSMADKPFNTAERFRLRWFTPTVEVPMCGHATLASAAVLFQELQNPNPTLHFETASGTLSVTREGGPTPHANDLLRMSLPLADVSHPPPSCAALDSDLVKISSGGLPVEAVRYTESDGLKYLLVVLDPSVTRQQLEGICPDPVAMRRAGAVGDAIRGVIVTVAGASGEYDFLSRFFGPWLGVDEDPVTGSAHAVLGPYWAQRLGKAQLSARQCSTRGGDLQLRVDEAGGRVEVAGHAVVVMSGRLRLGAL